MKGEFKREILMMLLSGPVLAADLFLIFLNPYKRRDLDEDVLETANFCESIARERKKRIKFNKVICLLKKEGIISCDKPFKTDRKISITDKGIKILRKRLPLGEYSSTKENFIKIISFDIPEKDRKKREWLRCVLNRLEFKMLQQSFWVGLSSIPEEFIQDMRLLDIFDKVHIFTIRSKGSLEISEKN
ncbi:MAG: hypothetical protein PHG66_06610 [Candidatus Colwellbacteria bacterium]|nr:hypothetical protein [Candidatus Colwellbacteria bacterium]